MIHKTITTHRGIMHYWVKGSSGQTLVFSQGATMDHGMFHPQVEHFAASHNANQDQPAAFNRTAEQFLSTIQATSIG